MANINYKAEIEQATFLTPSLVRKRVLLFEKFDMLKQKYWEEDEFDEETEDFAEYQANVELHPEYVALWKEIRELYPEPKKNIFQRIFCR